MLQIINISEARNNLSKLVKKVKETQEPIVIVQDSDPAAVIYPYNNPEKKGGSINSKEYAERLLKIKGGWFSLKEHKKMRQQINDRISSFDK